MDKRVKDRSIKDSAAFKALLMKSSSRTDLNLYDHLTCLLTKVLDEHPEDVVDVFEEMSLELKKSHVDANQGTALDDVSSSSEAELIAEQQRFLFSQQAAGAEGEESPPDVVAIPNVNEICFYFEQGGVGLGREEMQRVLLALKHLVEANRLSRCRLWGKILGIESNYIVAEADYGEGEREQDQTADDAENTEDVDSGEQTTEATPQPQLGPQIPPAVPKEPIGTGANKFVYYVCKEPGFPWVELPPVTPAQINVARQIRKFFTGKLEHPIVSYPPFPGNEGNYLRAQIARISAGTQVSPLGFYQMMEEELEEANQSSYEVNPDFEGIPVGEMAESLTMWVHQTQHILQQGRCTWVNLSVEPEESNTEAEEEEKEEDPEKLQEKLGPPLLNPLSFDVELFGTPPWSSRLSSTLIPQHAIAVLQSNLWPGAYAYAWERKFENIYIGWGLKYAGNAFNPTLPPLPQDEYPNTAELLEALDPTPEEEEAAREALEEEEAALEDSDASEEEDEDDN